MLVAAGLYRALPEDEARHQLRSCRERLRRGQQRVWRAAGSSGQLHARRQLEPWRQHQLLRMPRGQLLRVARRQLLRVTRGQLQVRVWRSSCNRQRAAGRQPASSQGHGNTAVETAGGRTYLAGRTHLRTLSPGPARSSATPAPALLRG